MTPDHGMQRTATSRCFKSGILLLVLLVFGGCVTRHSSKFPPLDYRSQFVPKFGEWRWDLAIVDSDQLESVHVEACLDDLKRLFGPEPFTFFELFHHPAQAVWFAVFQSNRIKDLVVIYIFDVQRQQIIGKIIVSLA